MRTLINQREVRRMKKQIIEVSAQVESIENAKELLADLEVLNEKYDVNFCIEKNNYSLPLEDFPTEDTTS
ncbi:hypothetical protein [Enterococcus hirae]|nr:hypothetical protein [Enterococcus hirae]